jgi:DNA-binding response OmpR family regulator
MSRNSEAGAVIFMIEEDDETRPIMRQNLKREGYKVLLAIDEEDALDRADGGGLKAINLILVNLTDKSADEALRVGREVRAHAQLDERVPVVVRPERYGKDVEGTDVNVGHNDWISYPDDSDQLQRLLRRLFKHNGNVSDPAA